MNIVKRIAISMMVACGLAVPALVPAVASAQTDVQSGLCNGANLKFSVDTTVSCQGDGVEAGQVDSIITDVIDILSIVVGVIAVIMIIIGGLKYITSNGDSGNVTGAKNTILYAVVGLVVVAVAQIIVTFVVGRVTTATTTTP